LASEHRNTVYLYSFEYRTASRPALSFPALEVRGLPRRAINVGRLQQPV
jgi:hypothetical protein